MRKQNLGGFKQDGIDFAVDYHTETGFGALDFSVSGTYVLNRKNQPSAGLQYTADAEFSKFKLRTNLGANIGNLRAQATWNYNEGYGLAIPVGLGNQMKIGDFSTVDLFFKYNVPGEGAFQDLAFTLNWYRMAVVRGYFGGSFTRSSSTIFSAAWLCQHNLHLPPAGTAFVGSDVTP